MTSDEMLHSLTEVLQRYGTLPVEISTQDKRTPFDPFGTPVDSFTVREGINGPVLLIVPSCKIKRA